MLSQLRNLGIPQIFAEVFATIFDKMNEEKESMPPAPFISQRSFITLFNELVLNNVNIDNPQTQDILAKLMDGFDISIFSSLGDVLSSLFDIFSNKANLTAEQRVSNMLVLFGMGRDNNATSKPDTGQ